MSDKDSLIKTIETMLEGGKVPYSRQDGRIRVRKGSTAVFLKPTEWAGKYQLVELLAPVLTQVERTEALLGRINDLNMGLYFGKAYWHDKTVWLAHNLLADDLDPKELLAAVGLVVSVADKLDDELKEQFGGTRWIDG